LWCTNLHLIGLSKLFIWTCTTYYHLTKDKQDILDAMHATDGTIINWKMMESVINNVESIDMLVETHLAGTYQVGKCQTLIHTLNWTNCVKKELVSITDPLCSVSKFLINKCSYCACVLLTETPTTSCPWRHKWNWWHRNHVWWIPQGQRVLHNFSKGWLSMRYWVEGGDSEWVLSENWRQDVFHALRRKCRAFPICFPCSTYGGGIALIIFIMMIVGHVST
jgi:hypothetical protein